MSWSPIQHGHLVDVPTNRHINICRGKEAILIQVTNRAEYDVACAELTRFAEGQTRRVEMIERLQLLGLSCTSITNDDPPDSVFHLWHRDELPE